MFSVVANSILKQDICPIKATCALLLVGFVFFAGCAANIEEKQILEAPKPSSTKENQTQPQSVVALEKMDIEFLYLASQHAFTHGQPALAARFLQAVISKDEAAFLPRVELGGLLLSSNQAQSALLILEGVTPEVIAEQDAEQAIEYSLLMAQVLIANQREEEASGLLQMQLLVSPENVETRLLLVRLEIDHGQFVRAHSLLEEGIRLHEDFRLRHFQVQLYLQQANFKRADAVLAGMQQKFPYEQQVVLQRSQLAEQQGEPFKAQELMLRYIDGHPNSSAQVYTALAESYVRQGKYTQALDTYKRRLLLADDVADVHMSMGRLYYQQADYAAAEAEFRQALALFDDGGANGDSTALYFYLGASLEASRQWKEAALYYDKVESGHSLFFDAQIRMTNIEMMLQKYREAEQRIHALQEKFDANLELAEILVALRMQQKQYQLLIEESESALAYGFSAMLLFNRAIAFEAMHQYDQLDATLDALLMQDPKHSEAMNFYGYSLADRGVRLADAEQLVLRALQIKPEDAYYLDSLAWVYFQQQYYQKAIDVQLRAVAIVANDPVMHEHLGDMYWGAGEKVKAKLSWQDAIDLGHLERNMLKRKMTEGLD